MRLNLNSRHSIPVSRLTNLILVRIIEWTVDVFLDREMEGSDSLHGSICAIVHARQQLRSAEAGLSISAGCKDRFITAEVRVSHMHMHFLVKDQEVQKFIHILDCNLESLISFQIEL